jgi:CcmD family protein
MTPIGYVGLAYALVFLFFFGYALRLTKASQRLEKKLEELERERGSN